MMYHRRCRNAAYGWEKEAGELRTISSCFILRSFLVHRLESMTPSLVVHQPSTAIISCRFGVSLDSERFTHLFLMIPIRLLPAASWVWKIMKLTLYSASVEPKYDNGYFVKGVLISGIITHL